MASSLISISIQNLFPTLLFLCSEYVSFISLLASNERFQQFSFLFKLQTWFEEESPVAAQQFLVQYFPQLPLQSTRHPSHFCPIRRKKLERNDNRTNLFPHMSECKAIACANVFLALRKKIARTPMPKRVEHSAYFRRSQSNHFNSRPSH